jgi:hypothetical protein
MTEDSFIEQIKREAQILHDEILKNNLKTDPNWWKVRFIDFRKKYNIKKAILTKTPHSFWLELEDSRVFDYLGLPDNGCFVKDYNCAYDPALMDMIMTDFKEAGILGDGVVNYEVRFGLEEK